MYLKCGCGYLYLSLHPLLSFFHITAFCLLFTLAASAGLKCLTVPSALALLDKTISTIHFHPCFLSLWLQTPQFVQTFRNPPFPVCCQSTASCHLWILGAHTVIQIAVWPVTIFSSHNAVHEFGWQCVLSDCKYIFNLAIYRSPRESPYWYDPKYVMILFFIHI